MKIIKCLLICIFSFSQAFAQNSTKLLDSIVRNLKKQGADTILIYSKNYPGSESIRNPLIACECENPLNKELNNVSILFIKKGITYKQTFICCDDGPVIVKKRLLSIHYFNSLKPLLKKKSAFYENLIKTKKFLPPISPHKPYEFVELITLNSRESISISDSQKGSDYKTWKKYFWIDKEIKFFRLIKTDLSL